MISDKELFTQMIERDILNMYNLIASNNAILTMPPIQEKIFSYADMGVAYLTNLLFGENPKCDIDEAVDVGKFVANEKIEEYRNKIKAEKELLDS